MGKWMWSRRQAGVIYAAHKDGRLSVPQDVIGNIYRYAERDMDELADRGSHDAVLNGCRDDFRHIIDDVFAKDLESAQRGVDALPGVFDRITDVRRREYRRNQTAFNVGHGWC